MIRSRCDRDRGATSWTTLTVRTSAGGVRSHGGGDRSGRSWVVYEIAIGWIHSLESIRFGICNHIVVSHSGFSVRGFFPGVGVFPRILCVVVY